MLLTQQIIVKVKYCEIIHKQCGSMECCVYGMWCEITDGIILSSVKSIVFDESDIDVDDVEFSLSGKTVNHFNLSG